MNGMQPQDELVLESAWQFQDAELNRKVVEFWGALGLVPPGTEVDSRLKELCAVGYHGNDIAGVATVAVRHVKFLGCRMAMFRCSTAPSSKLKGVATSLTLKAFDILEKWSFENPQEKVMGLGAVIQSDGLVKHDRHAVWPSTKLTFVGYTSKGDQFRVIWFKHGTVNDPAV